MVRIKLAILKSARAKDGSHKIRIAIGHKSETHYIVTPYSVPSLANFRNGTIIGTPTAHHDNLKLRQLLTDYEDRLERIPNPSDYTPTQLRDHLKRMRSTNASTTYLSMFDIIMREQQSDGRQTKILAYARSKIEEYFNGDISLSELTPLSIDNFIRHLRKSGLKPNSINTIIFQSRKVVNRAIRDGIVRYEQHPFAYVHSERSTYNTIDISVDDLRRIRDYEPDKRSRRDVRDIFMLSYYLGGINIVDLLAVDFRKTPGILSYIRHKTQRASQTKVELSIPPEAQAIIDRLVGKDGHIHIPGASTPASLSYYVSYHLKVICKSLGIPNAENMCYYSARKSFVQHGFDLGISLDILEYCVGHSISKSRTIYNYMRVMRRHADEAIAKIIANLSK